MKNYYSIPITQRPLYRRWRQIRQTIFNPNDGSYPNIGGRGIGIYWDNYGDFEDYILAHLGPPEDSSSKLNRIDQDRDYEPGNLRWALQIEVSQNTKQNINVRFRKETHSISEWLRRNGVLFTTYYSRLRRGWSQLEALGLKPAPLRRKSARK